MRALPRTVAVGVENTDMMDILDLLGQDLDDTQSRTEMAFRISVGLSLGKMNLLT